MKTKSRYLGKTHIIDANGQEITAQVVEKDVPKDYWKISLKYLIQNLGGFTPKAMMVVDYVLDNTNYSNNYFVGTNKSIAHHFAKQHAKFGNKKVGYTKIANTLSFLSNHNIIQRKPGVIMWNPQVLNHKDRKNVPDLIIKYRVMTHEYRQVSTARNRKRTAKARKARANKRSKRSAQNKSHVKKHQSKKSAHKSHNAKDLMANAPHQQSLFGKNQNYNARMTKLISGKQKTAQK